MRALILFLAFACILPGQVMLRVSAPAGSTKYCAPKVIDHTKVGASDGVNYVTFFEGHADLKLVANGGFVQNASGYDIGFYSTGDYSTGKYKWETVLWNASTGLGEWHVKIPSVSHTVDTTYYVCFGDTTITTDQSDRANTWPANLMMGAHLKDGTTLSLADFSTNNYTLTNTGGVTAAAGQIDGGAGFASASTQSLSNSATWTQPIAITLAVWVKATSFPAAYNTAIQSSASGINTDIHVKSTGKMAMYFRGLGTSNYDGSGSTTLTTGNWYYIVGTYSAANGLVGYVNGSVDGTAASFGDLNVGTVTGSLGFDIVTAGRNWNGVEDEGRWYSTEQSADWVTCTYNNQVNPGTFGVYGSKVNIP